MSYEAYAATPMLPSQRRCHSPSIGLETYPAFHKPRMTGSCNRSQADMEDTVHLVNDVELWDEFKKSMDESGHMTNLKTKELLRQFLLDKKRKSGIVEKGATTERCNDEDESRVLNKGLKWLSTSLSPVLLTFDKECLAASSSVASGTVCSRRASTTSDDVSISSVSISSIFNKSLSSFASNRKVSLTPDADEDALYSSAPLSPSDPLSLPHYQEMSEMPKKSTLICSFGGLDEDPCDYDDEYEFDCT